MTTRRTLEVVLTPAGLPALAARDLRDATCVVFDILRATSSMVTALGAGAAAIIPVSDIPEALALRARDPDLLLGGEREGVRIGPEQTGGVSFDLGNSPREYVAAVVAGRTIAMTTTNGTLALRASTGAGEVLAAAFLNLGATARHLATRLPDRLILVCSGTHDDPACEDVLGAGALADRLWRDYAEGAADAARIARAAWLTERMDLPGAVARSRNGGRLLAMPALRDDVAICLRMDVLDVVARMDGGGRLTRLG